MRGNTFNIGDTYTSWLQGPMAPKVWGARIKKYHVETVIKDVTNPTILRQQLAP